MNVIEIVVASGKGGVGKSVIAASISIILARRGYRVVVVDADAEAPNLHLILGVRHWDRVIDFREGRIGFIREEKCILCGYCLDACQFNAVEKVDGKYRINKWICEGCFTCSFVCPVKAISFKYNIVAGYIKVSKDTGYGFPLVSGEIRPGRPNSGKLVTEARNLGRSVLGAEGVLVIDAAAGIGCQVVSSLAGSHFAVLVAEPTPASLSDLKRIHKVTKHFGIPSALIINKYDLDKNYVEKIINYARSENIELLGLIPYDYAVPKSIALGKPVIDAFPESHAAKSLSNIAERVLDILDKWEEWRIKHIPGRIEPFAPIVIKPSALDIN